LFPFANVSHSWIESWCPWALFSSCSSGKLISRSLTILLTVQQIEGRSVDVTMWGADPSSGPTTYKHYATSDSVCLIQLLLLLFIQFIAGFSRISGIEWYCGDGWSTVCARGPKAPPPSSQVS
jgi:hypothetical protein